jgi:hypothetical protein
MDLREARLAFFDAIGIGHVAYRTARERAVHRYGYGPTLVCSGTSGDATLCVLPYSSGSGVVRVHMNRYAAASEPLGLTAEISCMPDELVELAPWFATLLRERQLGREVALHEAFARPEAPELPGDFRYAGTWTLKAREHERAYQQEKHEAHR